MEGPTKFKMLNRESTKKKKGNPVITDRLKNKQNNYILPFGNKNNVNNTMKNVKQ